MDGDGAAGIIDIQMQFEELDAEGDYRARCEADQDCGRGWEEGAGCADGYQSADPAIGGER